MKTKSAFRQWFLKQYGPIQRTKSTDKELRARWIAGTYAERELRRRDAWDEMHEVALTTWQVTEDWK